MRTGQSAVSQTICSLRCVHELCSDPLALSHGRTLPFCSTPKRHMARQRPSPNRRSQSSLDPMGVAHPSWTSFIVRSQSVLASSAFAAFKLYARILFLRLCAHELWSRSHISMVGCWSSSRNTPESGDSPTAGQPSTMCCMR